MHFANGKAPDAERNYTFIGTKGRIENIGDYDHCYVHVWTQRGKRSEPDLVYHLKPASGGHGGGDTRLLNDLFRGVTEDPLNHAADFRDGAKSILTGIAANISIKTGQAVDTKGLVKF